MWRERLERIHPTQSKRSLRKTTELEKNWWFDLLLVSKLSE